MSANFRQPNEVKAIGRPPRVSQHLGSVFHCNPLQRDRYLEMPAPKGFLFVNKTADSVSLSNNRFGGVPYKQINRQAQLQAKNRGKKSRGKESKPAVSPVATRGVTPSPKSSGPLTPESPLLKNEVSIYSSQDEEFEEEVDSSFGSPAKSFDSFGSALVALDRTKQNVLEYFTTIWMPSKDHIPPGCQITGLTPIRPHDGEIAFNVVQGAFQTHDEVSMFALLSASARRMQAVHNKSLERTDFPDLYTYKAIQALRKRVERGEPASERLILDLSFLILAELFTPSHKRSEVFWRMIRSLIVQVGGLQKLTTFTAQIALGFDHQVSVGTLSQPALDPFAYPELVGIKKSAQYPEQDSQLLVMDILGRLDPRIRLLALEVHALTELANAIYQFPEDTVDGMRGCLHAHIKQIYGTITEPLRRQDSQNDAAAPHNPNLVVADTMYLHARVATWRVWTWYATLSFLPFDYSDPIQDPRVVTNEIPKTWKSLELINQLLRGTGWIIRPELLLWLAAVGFFAATEMEERRQYCRLFRQAARAVGISTLKRLSDVLATQFPLELIDPNAHEKLWEVLNQQANEDRDWRTTGYGLDTSIDHLHPLSDGG
jgi:hypothetical protein